MGYPALKHLNLMIDSKNDQLMHADGNFVVCHAIHETEHENWNKSLKILIYMKQISQLYLMRKEFPGSMRLDLPLGKKVMIIFIRKMLCCLTLHVFWSNIARDCVNYSDSRNIDKLQHY